MISVVIPLYNKGRSIQDTINSVLNQSYVNFELIIVNDGSTDDSLEVVVSIHDPRIIVINKENGGVSSARNLGIHKSSYEYIAFLDGDDIWSPNHLEILYGSLSLLDSDCIGGAGTTFYKSHHKIFDETRFKKSEPKVIDDYFEFMSSSTGRFNSSTLLVKKSKILETGLFNESLKYGEDVEFWYKLFSNYKLIYNSCVTAVYFLAAENRSVHYVMPLEKRFHLFDYNNKSISEKKYLDKLVALIVLDYFQQGAYGHMFKILNLYRYRILGVMGYFIRLIIKKLK